MDIDYRAGYDFIMELQAELINDGLLDYQTVKALAATYELQDLLANRIARAVAGGELEPDLDE